MMEPIRPTELYDALAQGNITSESYGQESDYRLVVRFRTLADLQRAHRLLVQSCKAETDRRAGSSPDRGTDTKEGE